MKRSLLTLACALMLATSLSADVTLKATNTGKVLFVSMDGP